MTHNENHSPSPVPAVPLAPPSTHCGLKVPLLTSVFLKTPSTPTSTYGFGLDRVWWSFCDNPLTRVDVVLEVEGSGGGEDAVEVEVVEVRCVVRGMKARRTMEDFIKELLF